MKKRILSILVVLCLAVALPVVAFAAEEPAQIEVATLESLQEALADNSVQTIVITEPIVIPAEETVTIDLNGKTVSAAKTSETNHIYALKNHGELTITGDGAINSRGIYNYGSLTLNGGAINAIDGNGGYAVYNQSNSTFVMNGGTVAATYEDDNQSNKGGFDATALKIPAGCVATLNGGKIVNVCDFTFAVDAGGTLNIPATSTIEVSGTHGAIYVNGGTTTIDAGTFQIPSDQYIRTDNVLYVTGGELIVNGGTFTGDSDTAAGGSCLCDEAGTATINGGSFSGSSGGDVWGTTGTTIKGGTFANLTEKQYIADGFKLGENGAVVQDKLYVAEVGGTKYETLADAIAVGGEVKLLANIELTAPIVIEKGQEVVLNLGTYKISYTSTNMGEAMITNKGTLTINGAEGSEIFYNYVGAADSNYKKGNYTIANYSKLTVNGGKIYGEKLSGHAKYPIDNNSTIGDAELIINGGHLYNYNTSAIRQFCNSTVYKNTVTINGGLVEGYCAIWVQNPGNKTVNSELTINGGEIKSTAKAYVNGTSKLEEVGSAIYYTIAADGGAWSEDSFVALNGGTFNENVYLVESAPEAITIGEEAIFNGYLEVPVTEPTLIVDENNKLVMTDTQETHTNHRVTVYFLGDETVEDIYDEAALKAIDAEAKTYWGAAEINKVQLTKTGNYVLVLNYNNGVGTKKETVCVAASVVVPEQVLPTLAVKDNKIVVTEGDANVGNYRAVVYYLDNQTVADITDEAALKAIDPSAKTYWGLKEIEKVHLLKSGNYVVHLQYNIGKGAKQTVATAATVEFSDLTLKVVDGKLVAADPENAYIHHRAVVYYLGDETVEDIYDEAALKAIDASAKTYWGLNAINKAKLTQSGNYVVLLQYNLPDSPKMTVAVRVTI